MKKKIKWFAIFAAIGTAIGLVIAYLCKDNSEEETFDFDVDDDDLNLDSDLQPVERGYVSLNKGSEEVAPEDIADEETEATAEEAATETVEEAVEEEKVVAEEAPAEEEKEATEEK